MAFARKKQPTNTMWTVSAEAIGAGYHFAFGEVLAIKDGRVPAALASHVEPFDGPVLPGRRVREIDPDEFEKDVAAEARRTATPTPAPERKITVVEIIEGVMGGDAAAFETAGVLGFPSASGMRQNGARLERVWWQRDVLRWAERIKATAALLGK